ncbi:MAG: lactate racemase domain-containing protein [Negativicutes bacterium]|nr:lactate racemase domain-containing protein [Negativicutes bacterium]MDR3591213.1 lactate racemase domain-containing protein [Negativicutes bacterium]
MLDEYLDMAFPRMVKIRQKFAEACLADVDAAVTGQFSRPEIHQLIKPGDRVAVLVGSRGIAKIDEIVTAAVRELKRRQAVPFVVPAMGSHGGATAEGQIEVLRGFGITEERIGAPILSSLETVELGSLDSGSPVYFDRNAAHADGIIAIGRVKPHTAFRYRFESGLVKMISIGGGKQRGADALHARFSVDGFGPLLLENFRIICNKLPVLMGLAIVENAYDQPAIIEAVPTDQIEGREPELLQKAWGLMPRILFDRFDVLIVEQLGKNISGDGMDPNITGRYAVDLTGGPVYQRLAVLDLTPETHGNALGVGMADVTTRRLVSKIDPVKGYMNAFTSKIVLGTVKVPMTMDNDREAIAVALKTCVLVEPGRHKVVRIKNTLALGEIEISDTLLAEAGDNRDVEILGKPLTMRFAADGTLL